MAEPLLIGNEAGDLSWRTERCVICHQWAVEDLRRNPTRVFEADQIDDATSLGLGRCSFADFDPGSLELLGDAFQSMFVSHFPPEVGGIVFAGGMNQETVMIFIHAQQERAV